MLVVLSLSCRCCFVCVVNQSKKSQVAKGNPLNKIKKRETRQLNQRNTPLIASSQSVFLFKINQCSHVAKKSVCVLRSNSKICICVAGLLLCKIVYLCISLCVTVTTTRKYIATRQYPLPIFQNVIQLLYTSYIYICHA